jgi:hypothetical protein
MAEIPRYDQIYSKPEKPLDSDLQAMFDQAYNLLMQAAELSRERGQSKQFNWEFNTRIRYSGQIDAQTVGFGTASQ